LDARLKDNILFLITITNHKLSRNFQSFNVEESSSESSVITVVTDNYLSQLNRGQNGFSIIESPPGSSANSRGFILSKVTYDRKNNLLTISRGTTSGRAIYYYISSEGDFYCSTHIFMLRKAGVPIEENTGVLPEFFVYRYIMPPQTLYKNIKQMVFGSRLSVKLSAAKCRIAGVEEYNPPEPIQNNSNLANISAHTFELLGKSVDVLSSRKDKIAVLLSGGLDSSILFRICQINYGTDSTFSTGYPFEDQSNNKEKEYALSAANAFGAKHQYYEVTTKEYLEGFLKAISIAEEPLNHLQSPLLYLLFKGGLPGDKSIIVSGLGADDTFGTSFHGAVFGREKKSNKTIFKLLSNSPLRRLLKLTSAVTGRGKGFLNYLEKRPVSDPDNQIWSLGAYGSEEWVCRYFNVKREDIIKGRYDYIRTFQDRSLYDIISFLAFMGSASATQAIWAKLGEDCRGILCYPFCDTGVLDYAFSIPWEVKLESPKNLLRAVARQLNVPDFIISRPKSAFGVEAKFWSGKGGTFEPLVPLAAKVFDEKQIRKMQSFGPKNPMTFWNVLNYAVWRRLYIDNEGLDVLLEQLQKAIVDCQRGCTRF
jgi:asparagine synthase (glutamine-hydrolysing)